MSTDRQDSPSFRPFGTETGRRLLWAGLTLLVVAGAIFTTRGLPWNDAWNASLAADPIWLGVALIANIAMFPLWTSQWLWLTPPTRRPRWGNMLQIITLTSLTQNVLPLFGGQAAAVGLLMLRGGLSRAAALSVLALDQMSTGVAKLAALGVAALVAPTPARLRDGASSLAILVAVFLAVMLALAYSSERLEELAARAGRGQRIVGELASWGQHLGGLRRGGKPVWPALGYALCKKACEIIAAFAIQQACGIDLGWGAAALVIAALGLSTLIRTPGNLGIYEGTVLAIYTALGTPPGPALAAALLQHLAQLLPRIGGGMAALVIRPGLPH